jgi:hypothetical protein
MADELRKQEIPAAKVVFDAHTAALAKVEAASRAVHEALVAMVDYRDPMAPVVFDATWEQLDVIAAAPKAKLNAIFTTGFPTWSLAMASDKFAAILSNSDDANLWMRNLREAFKAILPVTSLVGSDDSQGRDIPAHKAVFDTHSAVLAKMEAASRAVHEAVVALVANRDSMAPVLLNATWGQLEAIANAPRSKLNTIFMTGLPTFSLSKASERFSTVLGTADDHDGILRAALESFLPMVSTTSR